MVKPGFAATQPDSEHLVSSVLMLWHELVMGALGSNSNFDYYYYSGRLVLEKMSG